MCTITNENPELDKAEGYKVVIKHKGKYYSTVTGIEYKEGKDVEIVNSRHDVNRDYTSSYWKLWAILEQGERWYNKLHRGKTSIYETLNDAKKDFYCLDNSYDYHNCIIVKFTLSGVIYLAEYEDCPTFIGSHIDKIEEIEV